MKISIFDRLGDLLGEINTPDIPRKGDKLQFVGFHGEVIEGYVDLVTRDYRGPKPGFKIRLTHVLFGV